MVAPGVVIARCGASLILVAIISEEGGPAALTAIDGTTSRSGSA